MRYKRKILITGGHLSPALATIDVIHEKHADWAIVFVGRRHAFEGDQSVSEEMRIIQSRDIRFLPLVTGRFTRAMSGSVTSLVKIPIGFIQSLYYLFSEKPSLVLSFGGYIALPVALAAWFLGIPIVTHEQTFRAGLANTFISFLADVICVSFPQSVKSFPREKTIVTGLPIRPTLMISPSSPPFPFRRALPILYLTGGSTGAESLNKIFFPAVPKLVETFMVIHQTGQRSLTQAAKVHGALPSAIRDRYHMASFFDETQVSWILHHAVIVIGRSGANTVTEVAALGLIALLVPLPWSANNEQQENALFLVRAGSAVKLYQEDLTPESFYTAIMDFYKNRSSFAANATALQKTIINNGATSLVHVIESLL